MPDMETPENPAGSNPGGDTPASPPGANNTPSESGSEPVKTPDEGFIPRSVFNERMKKKDEEMETLKADLEEIKNSSTKESKPDEDEWGDDETPLTKKDLKEWQDKQKLATEEKETMAWYDNRHKELSKDIDGKDGRPAYVKKEIVDFVKKNPQSAFSDPQDVYNKLHFEKLVEWRADQKLKANKGGYVEKDKPPKEPSKPDTSKLKEKDFDAHVREKYSS